MKTRTLILALALAWAAPAAAQAPVIPDSAAVDYIVAVVGNSAILNSQVAEEMFQQQSGGRTMPTDPEGQAAVRREIVNDLIDVELAVQQAQRDTTIHVTPEEVASAVEQQIQNLRKRIPSELDYRNELRQAGFATPEEYRRWLTDQQRRVLLHNKLIDHLRQSGRLEPVSPTEQEMRDYFDQAKGNLGKRPATISFRQIVVAPEASPAAKQAAKQLADSIATALREHGGDFATAARRFSDDPGSREKGGDLGWFRREAMIPEFSRVAFLLKPGVISNPVESPFGYHIIQVQRSQPTEVQARHILITPEVTGAEVDSARARAERILAQVSAGASFDSLQRIYHDGAEEKSVEDVPVGQLPDPYPSVLAEADSGAVVSLDLAAVGDAPGKFAVIQVTDRNDEGDIRFEDVRDVIRQRLSRDLSLRRYYDRLREYAYIDIRI